MTRVLVDTSAYSAAGRDHVHAQTVLRTADTVFVSPATLGELRAGFLRGSRRAANEQRLEHYLALPRVRVLDITGQTARHYAVIQNDLRAAGTPIPVNDLWIAASAMEHGLTVLTTDAHFLKVRHILVDYTPP